MNGTARASTAPPGVPPADRRRRGRFWPWLAGGLLAATVVKYAVVIALISADPSIAIEEDYYERAIAWDEERARREASDALGWRARIEIGPEPGLPGRAGARIALLDRDGAPVEGAAVTARIFHQARAAEAIEATCAAGAGGVHRFAVPGARAGAWRVELEARLGDALFIEERTVLYGAPAAEGGGPR